METLRGPDGCPWDKLQNPPDLNTHILEEAYEVIEAVDSGSSDKLKEELGDLLLQIVFHAQMAKEKGEFDMGPVLKAITEKLIRRHPHVFEGKKVNGVKEVLRNWEQIKAEEKREKGARSLFSDLPTQLPALLKAYRLGEKASRVGFDWTNEQEVFEKIKEEVLELGEEIHRQEKEKVLEEFGDLLFTLANMARFLKVNPEEALRKACNKFIRRFQFMEEQLARDGKKWSERSPAELDQLWREAKRSRA